MHQLLSSLEQIKSSLETKGASREYIRVAIKEELQNYVLAAIYESKESDSLIFIGGTCLRKLYGLNRLSEDLDFEDPENLDFNQLGKIITEYFAKIQFSKLDYAIQKNGQVSRLTLRFSILYDLGLSIMESEKLHIKVETTARDIVLPVIKTPFAHDNLAMFIKHYDLETMMAGKINACLHRVWQKGATSITVKGRDYYDLIWYMQKQIRPNLEKISLEEPTKTITAVFTELDAKVTQIKPNDLYADLKNFFESDKFIKDWCDEFPVLYHRYRSAY